MSYSPITQRLPMYLSAIRSKVSLFFHLLHFPSLSPFPSQLLTLFSTLLTSEELRVLGAFEDLSLNWRLVAEKILTGETSKWDPSIRLYGGDNAFPSGKEEESTTPSSSPSAPASSSTSSVSATVTLVNSCCGAQQKVIIGSVAVLSIIGLVIFLRKKK
jgi:hypothetical protein